MNVFVHQKFRLYISLIVYLFYEEKHYTNTSKMLWLRFASLSQYCIFLDSQPRVHVRIIIFRDGVQAFVMIVVVAVFWEKFPK